LDNLRHLGLDFAGGEQLLGCGPRACWASLVCRSRKASLPQRLTITSATAWLTRQIVFHCTPTSCSWLNAKLCKQPLIRGVFRSVVDLQVTINRFLAQANQPPKPFTLTTDPDKIIAAPLSNAGIMC